jgi:hypothetical protein
VRAGDLDLRLKGCEVGTHICSQQIVHKGFSNLNGLLVGSFTWERKLARERVVAML